MGYCAHNQKYTMDFYNKYTCIQRKGIKTHGSELRGQGKPPTWPRKTAHATTTESPLHVQPLLKTEQQNSPFYGFKHFTVVLN